MRLRHLFTVLIGSFTICASGQNSAHAAVDQEKPLWDSSVNSIEESAKQGVVEIKDGAVLLDGTNSFTFPEELLGDQKNYTIEFELQRPASIKPGESITLFSNADEEAKTGLKLRYFPPDYNAGWLFVNGYRTVEQRGFMTDEPTKFAFVVKDLKVMMFRNGSHLAATNDVLPSAAPLTFGGIEKKKTSVPYVLKNIKVYGSARTPAGFDHAAVKLRHYSGDHYNMQRYRIDNPALPRILIIGDSISMGYRGFINKHFEGRANIDYWTQNHWINMIDGENSPLERALSGVASQGPYDIITFNFGLHSWSRPERSPENKYIEQTTKLVRHLREIAPDTKWIWIKTTPYTKPVEGSPSVLEMEKTARIIQFNKMTDEIMAAHNIPTVDLYQVCVDNLDKASRDGVHWTQAASALMAAAIIEEIKKDFPKGAKP